MHILIIPSWYINTYNSLSGIFFKQQAEVLSKKNQVGVISIQEIGIKSILIEKKIDFGIFISTINQVATYQIQYPALIRLTSLREYIKKKFFIYLFKKYTKNNGIPDIVHLHSFNHGTLAIWLKENYSIPYVITEHSTAFAEKLISYQDLKKAQQVFKLSSHNIAVSNELKKLLETQFLETFQYIPNMVNIESFVPNEKNEKNEFIFINIAFLYSYKNQSMLIKSFFKAFKHNNNIRLIIVGHGPELTKLNKIVKTLKLENQVTLFGKAKRSEIITLLQNSDAFVLSSLYETFGVVLIEALACGVPVISTKSGGPESIIIDDRIGLLSDINENDLANKMKKMKKDITLYNANFLRQYAIENFSEKVVSNKLNTIYTNITGK